MKVINVVGYEGIYAVSDTGIIFNIKKGTVMKTRINIYGYEEVTLSSAKSGKSKMRVHRIVYESFNGKVKDDLVIDHIDNNKLNNDLSNLRKLTNRENICRSKVSKYGRGVHYLEKINKYGACIQINKIQYHLGVFCDVEDARNAYDKALSDWNDKGILPYKRDRTVKKCNACNEVKSVSEFYYIKGHGYQYMCKECQKKYGKEYRIKKKKNANNNIEYID